MHQAAALAPVASRGYQTRGALWCAQLGCSQGGGVISTVQCLGEGRGVWWVGCEGGAAAPILLAWHPVSALQVLPLQLQQLMVQRV
jgi:hypothetical protein